MRQDVAADLFLGGAFGLYDEIEGLVSAPAVMQCASYLKLVPYLALDRHCADIDTGTDMRCGLEVPQFASDGHGMDFDVGRSEGGEQMIGIGREPSGKHRRGLQVGAGITPVAGPCGGDCGDEVQASHGADQQRLSRGNADLGDGLLGYSDGVVVVAVRGQGVGHRSADGRAGDGVVEVTEGGLSTWLHMLAFRGHFASKSRHFSVTLGSLRQARHDWRLGQREEDADTANNPAESTLVVGEWEFLGLGYLTSGDAALAASIAAQASEARSMRDHLWQP